MASAIEKVIEIAANNLFDNASVQTCLTAVTDLSNNLDTRVTAVIDGAPGALNTLNELAAALNDDANFGATVTIALATKAVKGSDVSFNDISANDISANDVSGVHFFTTGGNFVGDLVGNATTADTVTTAAQPKITSVGTLTSLVVSGDLSANDISANDVSGVHFFTTGGNFVGNLIGNVHGSLTTAGTVQAGTLSVNTINEKTDASGVTIDGVLLKDGGAILTGDVSGNDAILNDVSGVHFFTTGGNFVGDLVGNATTAGTVITAAQPNITSVGTLTSLVVSGDLSANDCSFNVVDIAALKVNGVTIDTNGSAQLDLSTKEVKDLSDVSYNTVTSGQVLSWNTDGYFEPVAPTQGQKGDTGNTGPQGIQGPAGADGDSFWTQSSNNIYYFKNGVTTHVGINIDQPTCPLDVFGAVTKTPYGFLQISESQARWRRYVSLSGTDAYWGHSGDAVTIKADEDIWTGGALLVTSDIRIKENIIEVDDNSALKKVRDISCCWYNYKDKVKRGEGRVLGFLAQQVKKHLPEAIGIQKSIIPDEMKNINTSWNETKMSSNDLQDVSGIKYRFYVSNDISDNEKMVELVGDENNSFTFEEKWEHVFCYGKEVDDFHILDKQKLFALNFSATQELDKIVAKLTKRIEVLEAELAEK